MIDLAADVAAGGTCLQQALVVGGVEVPVDTSFRAWLRFGRALRDEGVVDPRVLLGDPLPGWQAAAIEFWSDPQELPRAGAGGGARAFDDDVDAPLVVAAFRQAYGIDLTDPATDLHWHLYRALLRNVPGDTHLAEVMSARSWTEAQERRRPETARREMRSRWALPSLSGGERQAALEYQMKWFGNVR